MTARCALLTLALVLVPTTAIAAPLTIERGTEIKLETIEALTSKVNVKGDPVKLRTTADVRIADVIVIPAGTPVVGQVADARAKGAMGMSGRLVIRPLYLQIKDSVVRLGGEELEKGSVTAGAVIGMIGLTPGFTGRSANIPAGTSIIATVAKSVTLTE